MAEAEEKKPKILTLRPFAIWRVHAARFRPAQFNPGKSGNARFSPIRTTDGAAIPTLYGARMLAAAMMETVLHDVPAPPTGYVLSERRLIEENLAVSRIRPKRSLKLVDLSTKGLKRLGLRRTQIIDTSVNEYAYTREWAQRWHAGTRADGLLWTSRQDDDAKALVIFGDRIGESDFVTEVDAKPLHDSPHIETLVKLAMHIGIEAINRL